MKKNILIYGIILLLACALTGTITYILMDEKDKVPEIKEPNNSNKEENQNENKPEIITLTDSEVNMYLGYIPTGFSSTEFDALKKSSVTVDNIEKKYLLSMALGQTIDIMDSEYCNLPDGLCNQDFYKLEEGSNKGWKLINSKEQVLNPILKTMYNISTTNLDFKNTKPNEDEERESIAEYSGICFYYENNTIYASECSSGGKPIIIPESYKLENNNLIIYSYAVEEASMDGLYYQDCYSNKEIKLDSEKINISNYVKLNKEKFTKYKNTFKKSENGYYWYSTEVVK